MNRILALHLLLFVSLFLTTNLSCSRGGNILTSPPDPKVNQQPIAAAHVSTVEVDVGIGVQFFDDSTDPDGDDDIVKWEWDFSYGPGIGFQPESEEQEPVHVFGEGGTHEVQLRVTDLGGLSDLLDEPLIVSISDSNYFNLQEILTVDNEIIPFDVEVQSHFAYILTPEFGLAILDTSNTYQPVLLSKCYVSHSPQWIEVEGNYVYLLSQYDSVLIIINIENPLSPWVISTNQIHNNAENMAIQDGYLYICQGWEGISIVDVSIPDNASIVGHIDIGACAAGIDVYEDYAVILDKDESAFYILDISTPESTHVVRTVNTQINFDLVELNNGYAYVAASQSDRLVLYDIDPPELTYPITEAPHAGLNITDIDIMGNSIYVYLENSSLYRLSLDPATPFSYISHLNSIPGFAIAAAWGRICIISESRVYVVRVYTDGSIISHGYFQDLDFAHDIAISGNKLLIVSDSLSIFNISDPNFPSKVGEIEMLGTSTKVETDGQYAYVLTPGWSYLDNCLSIININTLEIVVDRRRLSYYKGFGDIIIQNGYAYICNLHFGFSGWGTGDFQIWDIDPPAGLKSVGFWGLDGLGSDVELNNGFAYVTYGYGDSGGIEVFDVDPPESGQRLNQYTTLLRARALAISGDYVFVITQGSSESNLEAYKISGPGELEFIDSVTVEGYAERIVIDGHHAYIANFQGVQIFDIRDPENMTSLVSYFTEGNCINLEVDGDYLYMVDSEYGVRIIKLR